MAISTRRSRTQETNIWPGFVDALAALLMVIIFVLMIFIVAQFYLTQLLSGRDDDLAKLQGQILELGELLSIERTTNAKLANNIDRLNESLVIATTKQETLNSKISELIILNDSLGGQVNILTAERDALDKNLKLSQSSLAMSQSDLEGALQQLKNIETELEAKALQNKQTKKELDETRKLSLLMQSDLDEARDLLQKIIIKLSKEKLHLVNLKELNKELNSKYSTTTNQLNAQILALKREMMSLNDILKKSEMENELKNVKIVDLGRKLNRALASRVQELAKFRSEFFGRLQDVLKNRRDIRTVGDRFVFQSEVLFASGASDIATAGKKELAQLARTLNSIAPNIPKKINWILQIEGHTDHIPISNKRFQNNWELSAARAISVVEFLIGQGVPADRLSAAGYGEFQPLDKRRDEIGNRRNRRIEMKLTQR
ncbi:MAG: peptidoglycan-binding protein [Thalassobaculaceae bacterium]